jgi:hypothetical protein
MAQTVKSFWGFKNSGSVPAFSLDRVNATHAMAEWEQKAAKKFKKQEEKVAKENQQKDLLPPVVKILGSETKGTACVVIIKK